MNVKTWIGALFFLITLGVTVGEKSCQWAGTLIGNATNANHGGTVTPSEDSKAREAAREAAERDKREADQRAERAEQREQKLIELVEKLTKPNAPATSAQAKPKAKSTPSPRHQSCGTCVGKLNKGHREDGPYVSSAPYQPPDPPAAQPERPNPSPPSSDFNPTPRNDGVSEAEPPQPLDLIREEIEVPGKKGNWFTRGAKKFFGGAKKVATAPVRLFKKR